LRIMEDRRGISPVITTVIIVAVGITIAIAVALWMTGLVGLFMGYEKLEVATPWREVSDNNFLIHFTVKNTGGTSATVDNVLVNDIPIGSYNPSISLKNGTNTPLNIPFSLNVGASLNITMTVPKGAKAGGNTLVSGVSVTIKLHTASGREYYTSTTLP